MRPSPTADPRQRRDAFALAILLCTGILAPVVLSDPQGVVDQLFADADRRRGHVEDALAEALGRLDPVQAQLDATIRELERIRDDNAPDSLAATYFLDQNFDQGAGFQGGETARRVGGWGDWQAAGTASWVEDPRAPKVGERGFGFWDGNLQTQRYPVGPAPLDAYFVSPRVSLRALPVQGTETAGAADDAGMRAALQLAALAGSPLGKSTIGSADGLCADNVPECPVAIDDANRSAGATLRSLGDAMSLQALDDLGLAPALGDPHRIQLAINHRFHFATAESDGSRQGVDGGRVIAFYCTVAGCAGPTPADLDAFDAGRALRKGLNASVLRPLAADAHQYAPVEAFGPGPGFSGATGPMAAGDATSRFDLTPLAGRDVWFTFHAATTGKAQSAKSYFDPADGSRFDHGLGFYGWSLHQVHVDGPTWSRNVRIDEILDPVLQVAPGRVKAQEGPNVFSALLLNRGSVEVTTQPTLEVADRDDPATFFSCTPMPEDVTIRPGDRRVVRFTSCLGPDEGTTPLLLERHHDYLATFAADLDSDADATDNRIANLVVEAEPMAAARLQDGSLSLQPPVGDDTTSRALRMAFENPGVSAATLAVRVRVRWQADPTQDTWIEDPADPAYPRIVFTPAPSPDVVEVSADRSQQTVRVPVGQGGAAGRTPVSWSLLLPNRGLYEVRVTAHQAGATGGPVLDTVVRASTLLSAAAPYESDFAGKLSDSIVEGPPGSRWRDWTVQSAYDVKPPQCEHPGSVPLPCPDSVWELSRTEPDTRADPSTTDPVTDLPRSPYGACKPVATPCDPVALCAVSAEACAAACTAAPNACNPTTLCQQNAAACSTVRPGMTAFCSVVTTCVVWTSYNNNMEAGGVYTEHEGGGTPWSTYVLSARPAVEDLDPQQRFARLRVGYQYALQDLRAITLGIEGPPDKVGPALVALEMGVPSDSFAHDPTPGVPTAASPSGGVTHHALRTFERVAWPAQGRPTDVHHRMRYLDGQWITGGGEVAHPGDANPADADSPVEEGFSVADLQALSLTFRLPLPGDQRSYDTPTDTSRVQVAGCPARAGTQPAVHCPTWRVAYASLEGLDAATGEWTPLALFDGHDADTVGTWAAYAELGQGKATTCALATLPKGEELRCAGFHRRPVATLAGTPTDALRRFDSLAQVTRATGFWSNMEPDANGNLHYRGAQHLRLESPAVRIPAGDGTAANNPKLQFSQLYRFVQATNDVKLPGDFVGAEHTSLDGVTLLVRRLVNDGQAIRPVTPFLPVYVKPTHDLDANDLLGFAGRSAQTHADPHPPVIGETAPLTTTLDLAHLHVLDYRRVVPRQSTDPPPVSTSTQLILSPPELADAAAFVEWTDLADGKTLVQFAFQLDTVGEPVRGPCVPVPNNRRPGACDQFGWLLDDVQISQVARKAYDLQVTGASLQAQGYDWQALGLGPGTKAVVNVTAKNVGLFQVRAGRVDVLFVAPDGQAQVFSENLGQGERQTLSLAPDVSRTVSVPVVVPEGAGNYVVAVRLAARDIPLDAGTDPATYLDDSADDNCAVLTPAGLSETKPCDQLLPPQLAAQKTLPVKAVEDLRVSLSVTPLAGRVRFVRNLDVLIENRGNVVVGDATVTLAYRNLADPSDRFEASWTLQESPAPGLTSSWSEVDLDRPALGGVRLLQTARYLMTAAIEKEQPDGIAPLASVDSKLAASFDTFYSDDFAGGLDSQHPGTILGVLDAGPSWSLQPGLNTFLDPACCAWHFGDLANGTYPDDADDALTFPTIDLSTASKAVFSFAHRHRLEEGFDGARLEASTDGGQAWTPLIPASRMCPDGMMLLPTTGQPLCGRPQVAGTCPAGVLTGTVPTVLPGPPPAAVCGIPSVPELCAEGYVLVSFGQVVCALPKQSNCPSGHQQAVAGTLPVCLELRTGAACLAGKLTVAVSGNVYCQPPPTGPCPGGTVGLTSENRVCFVPAGYGGVLHAANALNHADPSRRDPSNLPGAFTGDSRETAVLQDGWMISEFDLAQVPGFTTAVEVNRLGQAGYPTYEAKHPGGREPKAVTSLAEWCEPGYAPSDGIDGERCWQRDNLHYERPLPSPDARSRGLAAPHGDTFLWSGASERNPDNTTSPSASNPIKTPVTTMTLRVPAIATCGVGQGASDRCLAQGEHYRLSFWYWVNVDPALTGVCGEGFRTTPSFTPTGQTTSDGWRKATILLQSANFDAQGVRNVTFTHNDPNDQYTPTYSQSNICNRPHRGSAVDDVRVEVYRLDSSNREVVHEGGARAPIGFEASAAAWRHPVLRMETATGTATKDPGLVARVVLDSGLWRGRAVPDGLYDPRHDTFLVCTGASTAPQVAVPCGSLHTLTGVGQVPMAVIDVNGTNREQLAGAARQDDFAQVNTTANPLHWLTASGARVTTAQGHATITTLVIDSGLKDSSGRIRYGSADGVADPGLDTVLRCLDAAGAPAPCFDAPYTVTFDLDGGLGPVPPRSIDTASLARWANLSAPVEVRWSAVQRIPAIPDAWQPFDVAKDRNGDPARVWFFGDADAKRYPSLARERLLTPAISLREVGGTSATLSFWERFDVDNVDTSGRITGTRAPQTQDARSVFVQTLDPQADGTEAWSAPALLGRTTRTTGYTELRSTTACADAAANNGWCRVSFDVSKHIGKKVRFAFEVETTRGTYGLHPGNTRPAVDPSLGLFWMLDQVGITATSLTGGPVTLRIHVATDASLGEGGLSIDNPQLVGFPYPRNVAMLPDRLDARSAAPGDLLRIDGLVRNLASTVEEGLVAQARVVRTGGCDPGPITVLAADRAPLQAAHAEAGLARSMPFALAPAGSTSPQGVPNDRTRFAFDVQVPAGDCGDFQARIEMRLLRDEPGGLVDLRQDANIGDHQRDLPLRVTVLPKVEALPASFRVDPPSVGLEADGLSAPIAVHLQVRNAGTTPLDGLSVRFVTWRTPLEGTPAVPEPPVDVALSPAQLPAPGDSAAFVASWRAPAAGFYRFEATVTGSFPGDLPDQALLPKVVGYALVGQSALFFSDDLEGGAAGWEALEAEPVALTKCYATTPPSSNAAPPPNGPELGWRLTDRLAYDGSKSFFVGTEDGQAYPARRDQLLVTPQVNLGFLRDVAYVPESPFVPDLTFRYMPVFGDPAVAPNNGMVVQGIATTVDGFSRYGPWTLPAAYDGTVNCSGLGNPLVMTEPASYLKSVPAFTGQAVGTWKAAAVRQSSVQNTNDPTQTPMAGMLVNDVFRFATGDTSATGVFIDSVAVSAFRSKVTPAQHEAVLTTGAVKTFYFRVQNTGIAADVFQVGLDPTRTQPSAFLEGGAGGQPLIPVEVLTPALPLKAGEVGVAAVRVSVPSDAGLPPITAGDIVLQVASRVDPNQVSTGIIHVTRLDTADLPHLALELVRPGSDGAAVDEQQPVSFLAVVRNDGRAPSRATDLLVLACPGQAGTPVGVSLDRCLRARQDGDAGSPHWPLVLKSTSVPALKSPLDVEPAQLAQTVATRTVSWVPPIGSSGLHHIVAVADAQQLLRQYEPRGVALLDLTVRPLQRPDVVVTALEVTDAQGRPVTEAFDGDVLTVTGSLANLGNAPARDVEASLSAQFELLTHRFGTLQPGESRTLSTQWVVTPGNYLVTLEAHTTTPLDDLDNNARRVPVGVRQGAVELSFDAQRLELAPGGTAQVVLRVRNHRDVPVSLLLPAALPEGTTVVGLPPSVEVARGGLAEIPLAVTASPLALPAAGALRIDALSPDAVRVAGTELAVHIGDPLRLVLDAGTVHTEPGIRPVLLRVTNQGGDADAVLSSEAPDGWRLLLASSRLSLAAGQARDLPATLEVPADAAPGPARILLSADGIEVGHLVVDVAPRAAWASRLEALRSLPDAGEAVAAVTNIGNAPGVPPLPTEGVLEVSPLPTALSPGESAVFRLRLAQDAARPSFALRLPGGAPFALEPAPVRESVRLVRWELLPVTGVTAGEPLTVRAVVRNDGSALRPDVPVRAYQDGQLVASATLTLASGEERTAELAWRPPSGPHVVTVVVGTGEAQAGESARLDVGAGRDAPAAGLLLALAALALAALARRRRA